MAFKPSSADSTRAPGSTESIRKYRNVVDKRLRPWCAKKGFLHLEQLGVEQIREFRRTWPDGPGYAIKNLERLRTFFPLLRVR